MEYLQLFDNNRNILQEKLLRSEKKNVAPGRKFMIVLVFIENDDGKYLIQKTSIQKNSEFAVTGGHVVYGDNGIKTVIKEAEEELGLKLTEEEIEFVDYVEKEIIFCEIYYAHKNIDINSLKLQLEEVESVDWYTGEEINNLINNNLLRKSNITAFQKLLDWKNKKK